MRMRKVTAALAAALAAVAGAACEVRLDSEGVVARETRRFQVSGQPSIELSTFDGSIEIHSWDRNEIEVDIERRAMEQRILDEMKVIAEQQGDRVVVRVEGPRSTSDFDGIQVGVFIDPRARLRVVVPRSSELVASSGDGSITIENVEGPVKLSTGDGSVRGLRLEGAIVVRSGDGSIALDDVSGTLDLETDDGSITVDGSPSAVRATTMDGSIRLTVMPDTDMDADWDLRTSDGSVVVRLPPAFDAVLDVETRDGAVRVRHPGLPEPESTRDGRERRRQLRATLGSGGHTIRVRSGDGSIRIE